MTGRGSGALQNAEYKYAVKVCMAAFKLIRKEYGKVCSGYEICTHGSCQSSHAAWVVADMMLKILDPSELNPYTKQEMFNFMQEMMVAEAIDGGADSND